jgi:AcrR family transcriptional regulator
MVETPWGSSDSLRSRMLPPGPGTPAEDVARNQRERLFGAMVASVATRGYAATRVTDLIDLSGISRRSFYDLFPDKEACFKAVVEEIVAEGLKRADPGDLEGGEERARRRFEALAEVVIDQPAAARLCLIEAYAASPEALRPIEDAVAAIEKLMQIRAAEMPERAGTPPEMIGALVGAAIEIIRTRLRRGTEAELPDLADPLMDFLLSYRPPPRPLRLGIRPPTSAPETLSGHDHEERALRAFAVVVAERGYEKATIEEVVKRASMSPTTFYANFEGKRDALMAAIDSAGAQVAAAILPAFRRNPDWPAALRAAYGALFNFMASRPAMAHLLLVDVYAAGPEALARRDEAMRPLTQMIEEGRQRSPEVPALSVEAIGGAVYSLAYRQAREGGAASLPALAPFCAYLTLAPFIGTEQACRAANGDSRPGGGPENVEPDRERSLVLYALNRLERPAGAVEISRELETSSAEVETHLEELLAAGMIKPIEGGDEGDETLYLVHMPRYDEAEWEALSQPQRERVSQHIGYLVLEDVAQSFKARTFDRRPQRFLARLAGRIDDRAMLELRDVQDEALAASIEVLRRSEERLRETNRKGFPVRTVQTVFEMPPESGGKDQKDER